MIVGLRAIAEAVGVGRGTALRDLESGVLVPSGLAKGGNGQPTYAFNDSCVESYRQYRQSLFQSPKGIRHRVKLKPERDLQAAIDKAYEQGYNAGRRASQREGNAANANRTTTGRVGAHLDGIPE